MVALSSPSVSHSPMARPCNLASLSLPGFSSLSLKPPAFINAPKKLHGLGLIRASVAVEQQAGKTKVALLRIGTRGRYNFFVSWVFFRFSFGLCFRMCSVSNHEFVADLRDNVGHSVVV